jgi:hypothetical protein
MCHDYETFERHWRAYLGYEGTEGWDEAYESVVNEERESFLPEDGRFQIHVWVDRTLTMRVRASLEDVPELRAYAQHRSLLV